MRVLMLDGGDRTPYLSRLVVRLAADEGLEMHYAGDPRWKDFGALEKSGVSCHEMRVRHKLDFSARRRIRRILDEHRIEILHTITGRDAYAGLRARGRRRRHVRTVVRRGAYPRLSRLDPADWVVYGRRGADRFVSVSEDLRQHMVSRGVNPERVRTVYTGIWSEQLQPVTRDLRAEHGLDEDTLLLALVGQLRPVKGLDYLLQGLASARRRGVRFHLLVAGAGYERTPERIAAYELTDRVTLLGYLDGCLAFTPNVDCVVVPSRIDALPRAAIEATVLGTPVIATRVGGLPEILDDGRAGRLVDPGNPEDLAVAVAEAADDRDAMRARAAAAQERNRELFSIERCAQAHLDLYAEALSA